MAFSGTYTLEENENHSILRCTCCTYVLPHVRTVIHFLFQQFKIIIVEQNKEIIKKWRENFVNFCFKKNKCSDCALWNLDCGLLMELIIKKLSIEK